MTEMMSLTRLCELNGTKIWSSIIISSLCIMASFSRCALFQFRPLVVVQARPLAFHTSCVLPTSPCIDVCGVLRILRPVSLNSTQNHRGCSILSHGCKGARHCGHTRSTLSALPCHHG